MKIQAGICYLNHAKQSLNSNAYMNLKIISIILPVVAAFITIIIGLKMADSLLSLGTWVIVGFAITPYVFLLYLTKNVSHHTSLIVIIVLSIITGIFGIWALLDSMFIHPDAQGGLAFIAIPALQWGLLLLATLAIYFFNKRKESKL